MFCLFLYLYSIYTPSASKTDLQLVEFDLWRLLYQIKFKNCALLMGLCIPESTHSNYGIYNNNNNVQIVAALIVSLFLSGSYNLLVFAVEQAGL